MGLPALKGTGAVEEICENRETNLVIVFWFVPQRSGEIGNGKIVEKSSDIVFWPAPFEVVKYFKIREMGVHSLRFPRNC